MMPPAGMTPPGLTALVGAGGKTTLMQCLARLGASQGLTVLCTTTTHLFPPADDEPCLLVPPDATADDFIAAVTARLVPGRVLLAALPPAAHVIPAKLRGLPASHLDALSRALPDLRVLVEADGAARRPVKAPADHEPVIPATACRVYGVMGLDALGSPIDADHVHRPERLLTMLHLPVDKTSERLVTPDLLALLATHPLGLFKSTPPGAERWLVLNKADDQASYAKARSVACMARERGFTGSILAGSARQNAWGLF